MAKPRLQAGERRVRLPRIRPYQQESYDSAARFKLFITGRRWGKGKVALRCAIDGHGRSEGSRRQLRGALQGGRIGWVCPSDKAPSAAEAWSDFKTAIGAAAVAVSEESRLVVLPGGGSVQILSGYVPDQLRGFYLDGLVVDECSLQDEAAWKTLRATLSDYGGWAILLGNVPEDVTGHWFVQLYQLAQTPAMRARGWEAWRRPSTDNPQLTREDLEEARETLGSRVYLREYEAELVGAEGGVWREEWFAGTAGEGERYWRELPAELTRMLITVDAAWKTGIRNDWSVAHVWARTSTDYYLLDELRGKWESPELRRRVAAYRAVWLEEANRRALSLPVYVEAAGGGVVAVQEFREHFDFPVLEYEVKGSTKMARHEAVSPLGESRKVWVPHPNRAPWIRATLEELVGFPELPHDDRGDAWTMGLQLLSTGGEIARAIVQPRPSPRPALIEPGGYV